MRNAPLVTLLLILAPSLFAVEALKLKITGIEQIPHDNDRDECGTAELPCHTREEYKVTAQNETADFVLSCKTDYLSYFKTKTEVSYLPLDKPMKVCMVFFHVGGTVTFRAQRGGWVPDNGVKDDAMQVFTIQSEKQISQQAK